METEMAKTTQVKRERKRERALKNLKKKNNLMTSRHSLAEFIRVQIRRIKKKLISKETWKF